MIKRGGRILQRKHCRGARLSGVDMTNTGAVDKFLSLADTWMTQKSLKKAHFMMANFSSLEKRLFLQREIELVEVPFQKGSSEL